MLTKTKLHNRTKGVLFAIVSSIGFGIMPFFVKDAMNQGLDTFNLILYRFLIASICLLIIIKLRGISLKISKKQFIEAIILGGIGYLMTSFFLYLSYVYISTGLATTLHFTYAAFVTIIMTIFFKEHLTKIRLLAITMSTLGVFLFLADSDVEINVVGAIFALITGITYAVYMIGIGKFSLSAKPGLLVIFYAIATSTIMLLISGFATDKIEFNLNPREIFDLFCLAIISTVISSALVFESIKLIGITETAILSTLEPIICMFIGVSFFDEKINAPIIIGSLFILLSVVLIAKSKKKIPNLAVKKNYI